MPIFTGEVDALGAPHGKGLMTYEDGSEYCGYFSHGARHGFGDQQWAMTGRRYVGHWKADLMHGKGIFYFQPLNGQGKVVEKYEGFLEEGRFHGYGQRTWLWSADGEVLEYKGMFRDGLMSGRGLLKCPDFVYDGDFSKGLRHGRGTCTYADGSVYHGDWVAGLREGRGMLSWDHGAYVYDGEWTDDEFAGMGRLYNANGYMYEGGFSKGKVDGDGCMMNVHGKFCILASFCKGQICGWTRVYNNDTSAMSVVHCQEGHADGFSIFGKPSTFNPVAKDSERILVWMGRIEEGGRESQYRLEARKLRVLQERLASKGCSDLKDGDYFESSLFPGAGMVVLPDGNKYVGGLEKGVPHGFGTVVSPLGVTVQCGLFHNGVFTSTH
eukprot:ANDGO_00586.mRNA.1 Alsin homolog